MPRSKKPDNRVEANTNPYENLRRAMREIDAACSQGPPVYAPVWRSGVCAIEQVAGRRPQRPITLDMERIKIALREEILRRLLNNR